MMDGNGMQVTGSKGGMVRWIAAALLLAGAAAGPGMTQEAPVDAVVAACFETARRYSVDPDCIGLSAHVCQAGGRTTTIEIGHCVSAETAAWDAILNREYQATRDAYADRPGLFDTLREAQRAWIALRDADCTFAYDRYGDGSIRSIAAARCELEHTARRALDLRSMRGN